MRPQIADSHLTYIGAADWRHTKYDVYLREGGRQLGTVTKVERRWIASDGSREKIARTRWEAALALWPRQEVMA